MSRRAIVALALLAGCASPGPYQGGRVLLQVEASGAVLETLGCVELRVHATTGADAFSDLRELRDEDAIVERFDTDASQMPLLYGLLPEIDEADRSFLVEALAFEGACDADGAPLGMARLLTSYVPGERRIARLRIERGCACPLRFERLRSDRRVRRRRSLGREPLGRRGGRARPVRHRRRLRRPPRVQRRRALRRRRRVRAGRRRDHLHGAVHHVQQPRGRVRLQPPRSADRRLRRADRL